ncbi:MAG: S9 family peptidase [Gammaproteobacteria bacterium]|nr:S9 family peptidase [Gammaproteobacteria bacterium]
MKGIEIKDLNKFVVPSNIKLSDDGKVFLYTKTRIDEKSEYKSELILNRDNKDIVLFSRAKINDYYFLDNNTVLFSAVFDEDKKRLEDGEIFTSFYKVSLLGGEPVKAFEVNLSVSDVIFLDNDNYIFVSEIDLRSKDIYKLKGEKLKKEFKKLKDEEDYEVIEESPFFSNGSGFVESLRNTLFKYNLKSKTLAKLIDDDYFSVSSYKLLNSKLYLSGVSYKTKMPMFEKIYELNIETKELKEISEEYLVFDLLELNNKLVSLMTKGEKYGPSCENPIFYEYDGKKFKVINDEDLSISTVLGDVEHGRKRLIKDINNSIYFISLDKTNAHLKRLNSNFEIVELVSKDGAVCDFDVSLSGRIIFSGFYDLKLEEIFELKNNRIKRLSSLNTKVLNGKYVSEPEYISTKVREEVIDGFVMKPINFDSTKKYPMILDIHGGPKCAYGKVFFHEMQVWASKGYFVIYCNPHGSDGYGNEFSSLNLRWGEIDYECIMSFLDNVLANYPNIDKDRLGCTGGSYGGYMSNWILGHTDRFKAIATQRSISNWNTMYAISDIPPVACDETCDKNPYSLEGMKQMFDVSPLKYVLNAKTPILFIHSDEDHRCPISEAYQLYTALVYLNVPTKLVVFHGENHELSRGGKPKHRERRLNEITNWFEKYLKDNDK